MSLFFIYLIFFSKAKNRLLGFASKSHDYKQKRWNYLQEDKEKRYNRGIC